MESSNSLQVSVSHKFDCYCKKTLRGCIRDAYRKKKKQKERKTLFSELSQSQLNQLFYTDTYFEQERYFNVLNNDVCIKHDLIAEVVGTLDKRKRDIILLYFFLGKSDSTIATDLNMTRSTVQYQRIKALKSMKFFLERKLSN